MTYEKLEAHPFEGVVRVWINGYGAKQRRVRQVWFPCAARKAVDCALCDRPIEPGDSAYRSIDNGLNRMDRICTRCVTESCTTKS